MLLSEKQTQSNFNYKLTQLCRSHLQRRARNEAPERLRREQVKRKGLGRERGAFGTRWQENLKPIHRQSLDLPDARSCRASKATNEFVHGYWSDTAACSMTHFVSRWHTIQGQDASRDTACLGQAMK